MKVEFNLEEIGMIRRGMMYLLDTMVASPYDDLYESIGGSPEESTVTMFFTKDAAVNEYMCVIDELTDAEVAIKVLEEIDESLAGLYKKRLETANKYAEYAKSVLDKATY